MSELRKDAVSGDWILLAPERAARPTDFLPKKKKRAVSSKRTCPFENFSGPRDWPPIVRIPENADPRNRKWEAIVIPNKYPAVRHMNVCASVLERGPFTIEEGVGHHEMVITRDHVKNFAHLPLREAVAVLKLIQGRYQSFSKDTCLAYALSFFNWGPAAGASLSHPHYQIVALPIIPPDARHSLDGSKQYYAKHKQCVHCAMIEFEERDRKRVLYRNAGAIVYAPFASRNPFEVQVFPHKHRARFDATPEAELTSVAQALQAALRIIEGRLNDPDLNFFIHSAPLKDARRHAHYHWHVEILPKVSIPGGFELGTGIDINVIDPDQAAKILRG